MVRATLILCPLLLSGVMTLAQQKDRPEIVRKGLLRAQATITPAVSTNDGDLDIYLHGDLEFYLGRRVSVRGDGYYFLGTQGGGVLQHDHSVFFGPQYHFPIGNFDPYVGLQPGASYVQARSMMVDEEGVSNSETSTGTIVPMISATTGFNFYVGRFIHFMGMVRYAHGRHAAPWGNVPLDNFRFSIGLGWNVNTIRAKRK